MRRISDSARLLLVVFTAFTAFTVSAEVAATNAATPDQFEFWKASGRARIEERLAAARPSALREKPPRNVIFFLGDGMGLAMVTAARTARAQRMTASFDTAHPLLAFERFAFSGLSRTSSYDYHTTDSAAGAMALFGGIKVEQETLGRRVGYGASCEAGEEAEFSEGVAELAIGKGYDVGFATTSSVTDATPGALYAKGVQRKMEYNSAPAIVGTKCVDIASQLTRFPANKFKVMFGGGRQNMLAKGDNSTDNTVGLRTDDRDIAKEWKSANEGRRVFLQSREELLAFEPEDDQQVLGIFADLHLGYRMDDVTNNTEKTPRLVEMSERAVRAMQKSSDTRGYFLMIEGALIDKAEHVNKMRIATDELEEFSHAIDRVRELVSEEDTLIIVTADHAHALTIPAQFRKNQSIYDWSESAPDQKIDDSPIPGLHFATGPGYKDGARRNYSAEQMANPHFVHPATVPMRKGSHGGEDVGLWAHGPFAWLFSGSLENTDVAYTIKFLLCLDDKERSICDVQKETEKETGGEEDEIAAARAKQVPPGISLGVVPVIVLMAVSSLVSVGATLIITRRLSSSKASSDDKA